MNYFYLKSWKKYATYSANSLKNLVNSHFGEQSIRQANLSSQNNIDFKSRHPASNTEFAAPQAALRNSLSYSSYKVGRNSHSQLPHSNESSLLMTDSVTHSHSNSFLLQPIRDALDVSHSNGQNSTQEKVNSGHSEDSFAQKLFGTTDNPEIK